MVSGLATVRVYNYILHSRDLTSFQSKFSQLRMSTQFVMLMFAYMRASLCPGSVPQPPLDRPAHLSAETHLPVRMHVALVLLWGTSRGLIDVPWSGGMAALASARLYGRQENLDLHDPQRCFDEKPYASYLSHYVKR